MLIKKWIHMISRMAAWCVHRHLLGTTELRHIICEQLLSSNWEIYPHFSKNKLPSWFSVLIPSKVLALPRCCFAEDRKRNKQSFRSCCRRRDFFKVSNNDKEREPKINEKVVLERAAWNLFEIRLKLADAGSKYKVEHNAYIVLN